MAEARMQLVDWLDDLAVRFLINLPTSELSSIPRLCFQVEEAQWYYEDFVRPLAAASGQPLPSLPLRQFIMLLFQHCPLFSGFTGAEHIAAYEDFLAYKVRVPVRGAILLDESMERVVLVRGWKKGANWSFPRGKINKDERDLDCAVREVYEETGFDVRAAGLIPQNEGDAKYIDITMREQHMRMFVFRNVPLDTYFEPKTRKEISKIQWYNLRELPGFAKKNKQANNNQDYEILQANKFYMVAPFLGPLKKWINQQRRNTQQEALVEKEDPEAEEILAANLNKSQELKRLLSIAPPGRSSETLPAGLSNTQQIYPNTLPSNIHSALSNVSVQAARETQAYPPHRASHSMHVPPDVPFPPLYAQQQFQAQRNPSYPASNNRLPGTNTMPPLNNPTLQGYQQNVHLQQSGLSSMLPGQYQQYPALSGANILPQTSQPSVNVAQFAPDLNAPTAPPHNAFANQPSQAPLGSGPPAPRASQLPPPRLNAHSAKLLEVFRQTRSGTEPPSSTKDTNVKGVTHQARLLDLFKQSPPAVVAPSATQNIDPTTSTVGEAATTDAIAAKPPKAQERRPTLNEITRTLPPPTEVPLQPDPVSITQRQASPRNRGVKESIAASGNTSKRISGQQPVTNAQPRFDAPRTQSQNQGPVTLLQRPSTREGGANVPQKLPSSPRTGPIDKTKTKTKTNGTHKAPLTILSRPSGTNLDPAPNTKQPSFQPQVLKRPDSFAGNASSASSAPEQNAAPKAEQKKGDQLLALFGKSPAISPASSTTPAPGSPVEQQRSNLLDTLRQPSPLTQSNPVQPIAPILQPERRPSRNSVLPQNHLLDLFKKPSNGAAASPDTPISPFTLGSPHTVRQPATIPFPPAQGQAARLGGGGVQRKGSGSGTPTEAKGFLLDFLNGVVQKEGRRG